MTKEELTINIKTAFKDVKLEDGIGLWEAQGLDDYADEKAMLELRKKDERNNWEDIPYEELARCHSSLSFFDAKGMRFCLPQFLVLDLLGEEVFKNKDLDLPNVLFTLGNELNEEYQQQRFSLFNKKQIQCVIDFLDYHRKIYEDVSETTIHAWNQKLK